TRAGSRACPPRTRRTPRRRRCSSGSAGRKRSRRRSSTWPRRGTRTDRGCSSTGAWSRHRRKGPRMGTALTIPSFAPLAAVGGEPFAQPGLIARWHDYTEGLMWATELVRIERMDPGRYRVDYAGNPLHSVDSPSSRPALYVHRDTPIDSLETPDLVLTQEI